MYVAELPLKHLNECPVLTAEGQREVKLDTLCWRNIKIMTVSYQNTFLQGYGQPLEAYLFPNTCRK
jgi:hypothetical protein